MPCGPDLPAPDFLHPLLRSPHLSESRQPCTLVRRLCSPLFFARNLWSWELLIPPRLLITISLTGRSVKVARLERHTSSGHRLPTYTTAYQAELMAILMALQHAHADQVRDVHLFLSSVEALHFLRSLHFTSLSDNVQLMSFIHRHLHFLYQEGSTVTCHWILEHVGILDNERADEAARLAGNGNHVTFDFFRSLSSIKTSINRAAIRASRWLLEDAVAQGSRSAF